MKFKVLGMADCLRAFNELPQTVQNRLMRVGLNAAGGVVRDAAKALAPRETGLLSRSLKVKVRVPKASYNRAHHSKPAYAVIGPARRFSGLVTTSGGRARTGAARAARAAAGQLSIRRPARYAHLVRPKFLHLASRSAGEAAKAKMLGKIRDGVMNWARAAVGPEF